MPGNANRNFTRPEPAKPGHTRSDPGNDRVCTGSGMGPICRRKPFQITKNFENFGKSASWAKDFIELLCDIIR
jgi:hypothetical protein